MLRALKMRFYPTEEQAYQLNLSFGHARWVYNYALETRIRSYKEDGIRLTGYQLMKLLTEWKKEHQWLGDVSNTVLQQKISDGDRAFGNFFRGIKSKRTVGYPKFKSRNSNNSIRFVGTSFHYRGGEIQLAKQSEPLNIVWSYEKPDNIKSVTVSRNKANQYFISILTEVDIEPKPQNDNIIGLDLGIKDHVTTSNSTKHNLPNLSKEEKKIIKLQRRHAKKEKGSKNREKARVKLAKAWVDLTNKRNDYLHKLSTQLINENQVIIVEDLAVSNMVKNRKLARSISKQSWYTFTEMLRYKSEWYGREFIKIDRFYPSSKTCFECKAVVESLPLNIRQWQCDCGALLDRDINAAKNIKAVGLIASAYGEDVRAVVRPDFNEVGNGDREVAELSK